MDSHINVDISKFDIKKIKPNSTCVLIGKRGTGKSVLVKEIMYHMRNIPIGTVFTLTDEITATFSDCVPPYFIKDKYDSKILENIFDRQKKKITDIVNNNLHYFKNRQECLDWIKTDINNYCFVTLDDILSDSTYWKNDKQIKKMFFEGRHYLILFILTMQIPLGIPPSLRTNIDYVFITKTVSIADKKKLFENYGGSFNNFEHFKLTLDIVTDDHKCMVIDNQTNKSNFTDQIFWYKGQKDREFKICSDKTWEFSKRKLEEKKSIKSKTISGKSNTYQINTYYRN